MNKKERFLEFSQRFLIAVSALILGIFCGMSFLNSSIESFVLIEAVKGEFILQVQILFASMMLFFIAGMILIDYKELTKGKKSIIVEFIIQRLIVLFLVYEMANVWLFFINDAPFLPSVMMSALR